MRKSYKLFFLFLIGFLFSCGVKSSPLPPEDKTPKVVDNLNIKQQGNLIVLYWKYNKAQDISFKILLNGKEINLPIFQQGNLFWIEYPFKGFSVEYCFQVETIRGIFSKTSKYKCITTKKFNLFSDSPKIFQKEGEIYIKWEDKKGEFFIYKEKSKNRIPPIVYSKIKNNNIFEDRNVISGQKYCYFLTKNENQVESNRVYTECITYVDIYPPKKPKISYIKNRNNLIIILGHIDENDFAGFLIEKNGKLLTNIPTKTYYFIDKNWHRSDVYKIYSVDKNGNKSSPVYLRVE